MNVETAVSGWIAGLPRRDLPKGVYPRGKMGYLYFIRGGACVRIHDEPGTPEFENVYADLLARYPIKKPAVAVARHVPPLPAAPPNRIPPPAILHQLLIYNADGSLTWRERDVAMFASDDRFSQEARAAMWNGRCAGKRADRLASMGRYRAVSVLGTKFLAHRVIWMMVYGSDPEFIDHISGDGQDNRIVNLRSVDTATNMRNMRASAHNTSGQIGVTRHKGKWRAQVGGVYLGLYATFDEAVAARKEGERQLDYHPNHGRPAPTRHDPQIQE